MPLTFHLPSLRSRRLLVWLVVSACLPLLRAESFAAQPRAVTLEPGQEFTVSSTHDGRPFTCRVVSIDDQQLYRVVKLAYPSPVRTAYEPNNTIPATLFLPADLTAESKPRPGVICLHILSGQMELVEIMASNLARRGIPAITFNLPYYGSRGYADGPRAFGRNPQLLVDAVRQTAEDVRRTIDLLACFPEIDDDKVGIAGISLGGIVSASAAEREPRLYKAALILSGGDLRTIIASAPETELLRRGLAELSPEEQTALWAMIDEVDPLRMADRLRERAAAGRVLMINAAEDEVIPRECTEKLARAVGMEDRVHWLEKLGHYTTMAALPQVLDETIAFFAADLPDDVHPPESIVAETPAARIAQLVQQVTRFFLTPPKANRCHMIQLSVEGSVDPMRAGEAAQPFRGTLTVIRGNGERFRLEGDIPELGKIALGQSDRPWLLSRTGTVFEGRETPAKSPLVYVDERLVLQAKMVLGAAAGATMTPQLLTRYAEYKDGVDPQGRPVVIAQAVDNPQIVFRFTFAPDGSRPAAIEFHVGNVHGTTTVGVFQLDAPAVDPLFQPPEGERHPVNSDDLYRMIAAVVHFAVEQTLP